MLPSIFDDVLDSMFEKPNNDIMKTDVKVVGDNYLLDISIPGYDKENIKLELERGYLTVTAEQKNESNVEDNKEKYIRREISYGKCSRTFYVGDTITEDEIKASYKNGILTVTVPKVSKIDNKKVIQIED